MSTSAVPLQRYLTDFICGSVPDEIDPSRDLHENHDQHPSSQKEQDRNGDSGENRAYHRRSQRDRLLHRSGIASKWSEGNLAKFQICI